MVPRLRYLASSPLVPLKRSSVGHGAFANRPPLNDRKSNDRQVLKMIGKSASASQGRCKSASSAGSILPPLITATLTLVSGSSLAWKRNAATGTAPLGSATVC
jgi:hypothetical protein